jgi:hypothetical protein
MTSTLPSRNLRQRALHSNPRRVACGRRGTGRCGGTRCRARATVSTRESGGVAKRGIDAMPKNSNRTRYNSPRSVRRHRTDTTASRTPRWGVCNSSSSLLRLADAGSAPRLRCTTTTTGLAGPCGDSWRQARQHGHFATVLGGVNASKPWFPLPRSDDKQHFARPALRTRFVKHYSPIERAWQRGMAGRGSSGADESGDGRMQR